jgi:hypothetical protein
LPILKLAPHPANRLVRRRIARRVGQLSPTANQRLMAYVNFSIILKRSRMVGSKEAPAGSPESRDYGRYSGTIIASHGGQICETAGAADYAALGIKFCERAEQPLCGASGRR